MNTTPNSTIDAIALDLVACLISILAAVLAVLVIVMVPAVQSVTLPPVHFLMQMLVTVWEWVIGAASWFIRLF